jgi:hypothetical protein
MESRIGNNTPVQSARIEEIEDQKLDRDFFSIQVEFAKKLAKVSGQPFFDVLRTRTNFYVRLGLGKSLDASNPIWQEFMAGGEEGAAERAYNMYMAPGYNSKKREKVWFGCFNPEYEPEKNTVYVHFGNKEKTGSPFDNPEKLKQELKEMFEYIKKNYPDAQFVAGRSWLYNVEKYKNLFPPEYTAHMKAEEGPSPDFATWGQFINRNQKTKPEARDTLYKKLESAITEQEVFDAVPLKALSPQTTINNFYRYYGIG